MTTTGKMRRRRYDAPANNARGFGEPTTSPRQVLRTPMCRNNRQMIAYEIVSAKLIKTPKINWMHGR